MLLDYVCSPCANAEPFEAIAARLPAVFDDGVIGLGPDGLTHDDPYCGTIAPLGSYEARHGEPCSKCEARKAAAGGTAAAGEGSHPRGQESAPGRLGEDGIK